VTDTDDDIRHPGMVAALAGWVERHLQTAVASLGRLVRSPVGSLLTCSVIGIALVLPASLEVLLENTHRAASGFDGALDLTVYLKPSLSPHEAEQLAERIGARGDIGSARFISAAEGLAEFRHWSGLGAAVDALGANPLPAAVVVRPRPSDARDEQAADRLGTALRAVPGVDTVELDVTWVRRYSAVVTALQRTVSVVALLLALTVLLVVGNTIRLDIDARRAEIEVVKLVGGSDGFVRRPFLYEGVWVGLCGGVIAWVVLEGLVLIIGGPIGRVAAAYGSPFVLHGPSLTLSAQVVLGGALLGWVGAFLATGRHLRTIEPGLTA
jgi:cell division transport system permease protein